MSNNQEFSALFLSDLHLRNTSPRGRKDNFWDAQERKLDFIIKVSNRFHAQVIIAGDVGDCSEWDNSLLTWAINKFKKFSRIPIVIPGQHDLPNHSMKLYHKSALSVLEASGVVYVIKDTEEHSTMGFYFNCFSINDEIKDAKIRKYPILYKDKKTVAIIHKLVTDSESGWESEVGISAKTLLKKYKGYDLFVCGDNHKQFIYQEGNRIVLNCGSVMRSSVAQIKHIPRIFLWDDRNNEIKRIRLPIEDDVFDESFIETSKEKDKKIEAFVESLSQKDDYEVKTKFTKNMKAFTNQHQTEEKVKDKIWEAIPN